MRLQTNWPIRHYKEPHMKTTEKQTSMVFLRTTLGIIGFLLAFTGATITNDIYSEIEDVEIKVGSQEEQIDEIGLTTREILVGMRWQSEQIKHIAEDVKNLEIK
jgi:uncharacterized coiled-coil protein SlyX